MRTDAAETVLWLGLAQLEDLYQLEPVGLP